MFLVPKSSGSFRAVVDYSALNKNIEIESVPLPDIHSLSTGSPRLGILRRLI
jgi:hypothetical protein